MRIFNSSLITLLSFVVSAQVTVADPLTRDELSALSQLGAAYTAALVCNFSVQVEASQKLLASRAPHDVKFDTANMIDAMAMVVAIAAFDATVQGYKDTPAFLAMKPGDRLRYCHLMFASFGPDGTSAPGLLKPQ